MIDEKEIAELRRVCEMGVHPTNKTAMEMIIAIESLLRVYRAAQKVSISGRLVHRPEACYQINPMTLDDAGELRKALAALEEKGLK